MQGDQDLLTEVLDVFPLPITYTGFLVLRAPWGVSVPAKSALLCSINCGGCWLTGSGVEEPRLVSPGDLLLLSPNGEHQLRDRLASPVVTIHNLLDRSLHKEYSKTASEDSGGQTRLTAGLLQFFDCDSHPLCSALPSALHLALAEQKSEIVDTRQAIENELSTRHSSGGQAIARRLMEVLYIQIARQHLATATELSAGVMRGMMHREIGTTLRRIHDQPDRPYTVESLAEFALMSRSAFSAAFSDVVGMPPLQYVREYRMRVASLLLRDSSLGLKEVASHIGYHSVSAFSKAFKQSSGLAPNDFRHRAPPVDN